MRPASRKRKKVKKTNKTINTKFLIFISLTKIIEKITKPIMIEVPKSGCCNINIRISPKYKNNGYFGLF